MLPGWSNKTNPYTSLLCDALVAAGATVHEYSLKRIMRDSTPDIVHVHWPEYSLTFGDRREAWLRCHRFLLGMRIARLRGAKVFWTAHNLRPHERTHADLEAWFYRRWLKLVDGISCLSNSSRVALGEAHPAVAQRPTFVIRHGDYRPGMTGASISRSELGINESDTVLVSLGAIRTYKNIPHLCRVFRQAAMPGVHLLIAGKIAPAEHRTEILEAIADNPAITLREGFMDDPTMEALTSLGDLTVLPYRDILNSGTALFSLSCNRPVLVPSVGSLPELQTDVGGDWVQMFSGELSVADLHRAVNWVRDRQATVCALDAYAWPQIAEETMGAYETVLRGGR
jgi:glycosyltransferase involved in cell wall biosynthesis